MTATLTRTVCIPADHPALPGHFPGNPVVPGVVLLDAVAALLESEWQLAVRGLPQVKFVRPLKPGEAADIVLERSDAGARFRIHAGADTIASGTLEAAA